MKPTTQFGVARMVLAVSMLAIPAPSAIAASFQTLHIFTPQSDATGPEGDVILVGTTLYGTSVGGVGGNGTVFSMNRDGSNYQTLHTFTGGGGADPYAGLTLVGSTLYGTTVDTSLSGGSGTVFSMNLDGSNFRTVHSFSGGSDGAHPQAGLTLVGSRLYGTTTGSGGNSTIGTVFAIVLPEPSSMMLAVLGLAGFMLLARRARR
jgi:hypothetical protein